MARRPLGIPSGTQRRTRHRRLVTTTVSSISSLSVAAAAAAASSSLGVKPQAEAPHSAPVAPRGALCRRLRRRTCSARARTQRHQLVAARARAGPTWESERSSSVTRARQGARRKGRAQVDGKSSGEMVGSRSVRRRGRLEPAAAGRRRARARRQKKRLDGRTHTLKRSEPVP